MKWLLAALRMGSEFAGVFTSEIRDCAERARVARGLGPSWSVTYAADAGDDVEIRFDHEPETENWRMIAVRVKKTTGEVTVTAKIALNPAAHAN